MNDANERALFDEHLPYELKMLRFTAAMLEREINYLSWNAYLESFAVHARNLVEFLTNTAKPNNFRASDFDIGQARIGDHQGPMQKLRQQILHLGKRRVSDARDKFDVQNARDVAAWAEENFSDFLTRLPDHKRQLFNEQASRVDVQLPEVLSIPSQTTSSLAARSIGITIK